MLRILDILIKCLYFQVKEYEKGISNKTSM